MLGLSDAIPPNKRENLLWRREMRRKAKADGLPYQKKLMGRCREDVHFYINGWVWQYNPNNRDEVIGPFIEWDFQREAVDAISLAIDDGHDLVIEKSREMGASWLCLIVMEHRWHFREWQKFLMVSRSADAVDEPGDPDCLFWKLDFIHDHQPDWFIKPQLGYKKRRKMGYKNYVNGSTITGEASTGKVGVGGRATAMFVDEFAQIKEDYDVLHRTSDTTKCRIFNSTHLGLETAFYELTRRVDMRKLRMHWTQHPEKVKGLYQEKAGKVEVFDKHFAFADDFEFVMDGKVRSPWYDEQCRRKGSARAIAMDLDIDPSGSVEQFFDPVLIRLLQAEYGCEAAWEGRVENDGQGKTVLVQQAFGQLRLWMHLLPDGSVPKARYVGGVDTATGTGASPSCFSIANGETGEKVAELTEAFLPPDRFADVVIALCRLFVDQIGTPVYLGWEANGPGSAFGKRVIELGYRHVLMNTNENRLDRQPTTMFGWRATVEGKRDLLTEYAAALRGRHFLNRSREA